MSSRQTITHWRLIVVDDAGPDPASAELVHSYHDARVTHHRNPSNLGLAGNWNRCLELAETDLVTLLHADDELLPRYGELVLRSHRRAPDAAAVFPRAEIIDQNSEPLRSVPDLVKRLIEPRASEDFTLEGEAGLRLLMRGQFIFCPSLCFRRSVVGPVPFSDRWRMVPDLEVISGLLLEGRALVGIPEVGYAYRRHGDSQTAILTDSSERFSEELAIFAEIADRADARGWTRAARVARRSHIVRLHIAYRILGDLLRGRRDHARTKVDILRQARTPQIH